MRPRNSITVWGRTAELVVEVVRLVLILRHGSPRKCVVTGVMLCFMGQNVLRHIGKNREVGKVFVNGSVTVWNVVMSTRQEETSLLSIQMSQLPKSHRCES